MVLSLLAACRVARRARRPSRLDVDGGEAVLDSLGHATSSSGSCTRWPRAIMQLASMRLGLAGEAHCRAVESHHRHQCVDVQEWNTLTTKEEVSRTRFQRRLHGRRARRGRDTRDREWSRVQSSRVSSAIEWWSCLANVSVQEPYSTDSLGSTSTHALLIRLKLIILLCVAPTRRARARLVPL